MIGLNDVLFDRINESAAYTQDLWGVRASAGRRWPVPRFFTNRGSALAPGRPVRHTLIMAIVRILCQWIFTLRIAIYKYGVPAGFWELGHNLLHMGVVRVRPC